MRLSLALLTTSLLVVLDNVHAHPAFNTPPFVSVPISRVPRDTSTVSLPPTIIHQQHANRAIRRLEHMTGASKRSSNDDLLHNLQSRAATLPVHVHKRYLNLGLGILAQLGTQPHKKVQTPSQSPEGAGNFKAAADANPNVANSFDTTPNGVTPAKKPTFPNSVGLDIQAKDVGYLTNVQIGTPPRDFLLLVDSGSADLWVGAEGCQPSNKDDEYEGCGAHTFLGPKSSSTFNNTKKPWDILYGTGSVKGTIVTDNVAIAGLSVNKHTFGVAEEESQEFLPDFIPFSGLLGLAMNRISRQHTPTLLDALYSTRKIKRPIASYHIPRAFDGAENNDGELALGGMNPNKYVKGTTVTVKNVNALGFWEATVQDVIVEGGNMGWGTRTAILDTGTTLIMAPLADVDAIHERIPGAWYSGDKGQGYWTFPCLFNTTTSSSPKDMLFGLKIGGRTFSVDPRDLPFLPVDEAFPEGNCTSGIVPGNVGNNKEWLVGDVFLKNVYMSTDASTNKITFAKLKPKKTSY